jgi:hypothetical protein
VVLKRRDVNIRKSAPGTPGADFDKAFAAARKAGKDKFTWNGKPYNTNVAKPEFREKKTSEPMKPAPKRTVDIPPVKSGRKIVKSNEGSVKKPKVDMYAKKKVAISPDWKSQGKAGEGKGARAKYIAAKVSPLHAAKKGPGGIVSTGRYKVQSAVRPVSEKDAYKKSGELKRGVVKTSLGSEQSKGGSQKRTSTGLAKENKLKGKKY